MVELTNKIAIVTGASGGIGKAIAFDLALKGVELCLVGRDINKLKQVAASVEHNAKSVRCYRVDLLNDGDIKIFVAKIKDNLPGVDILVHSAGVIYLSRISVAAIDELDIQYRINVRAPLMLTQLLLPMVTSVKGQIVFINSSAAINPGIENGLYAATKAALRSIADSLRKELNSRGIRVLSIFPGRTASPMQENIFRIEGGGYNAELLIQPGDIASLVVHSLSMPWTAELTDIRVRPFCKI